jgi:hypothetical protein
MNRFGYLACEWLLVWLLLSMLGAGMIWLWDDDSGLKPIFLLGWAVASAFTSAKWVLVGSRPLSPLRLRMGRFYNPARPIAALSRAGWFEREGEDRTKFLWPYHDALGRGPFEILAAVSAELRRQGVQHTNVAGIGVIDGPAVWRVEPASCDQALEGWVEAEQMEDRAQILSGLRRLLTEDLSVQIDEGRP